MNQTSLLTSVLLAVTPFIHAATLTVTTTADNGIGSLRQAILDANASAGIDVIAFNIAPGGLQTIAPVSALPDITEAAILDATTQPGFAGTPIIELNGANAGASGLRILTSGCTVRGLVINRVPGNGIELIGGGGHLIAGNYIGTDASGTIAQANNGRGINIEGSSNNRIGGTTTADRNVISGNFTAGVEIFRNFFAGGPMPTGNVILGNYIGADATGTTNVFNGGNGINLLGSSNTVIGGTAPGSGNLIRGIFQGILIQSSFDLNTGTRIEGNQIIQNFIGLNFTALAQNNIVGGTAPGAGNVIAFQAGRGIAISGFGATNNAIRGNSMHSNGLQGDELGIDLGFDGVTLNDPGDTDTGDNWLQNFPVITSATASATTVTINGTLNSLPGRNYFLDFFSSSRRHPRGHGEGEKYLGSTTVTTDGSGNVAFTANLNATLLGRNITATATDEAGNTSEFSLAITAVSTAPGLTFMVVNTNNNGAGSLRSAIEQANAAVTMGDTIRFDISGPGPFTIFPSPPLPEISDVVAIDGTTQPGFAGTPIIELSGASAGGGATADGLRITAGGSTVRGLVINRFASDGIELIGAGGNRIENCYLGLNAAGTGVLGNSSRGIFINNSPNNVIGGNGSGNTISGNNQHGIEISGTNATNNAVLGNVVGLGVNAADLGNTQQGIQLSAPGNVIGGAASGARNIIAGNNGSGISLPNVGASNNVIQGNVIGFTATFTGVVTRANSQDGLLLNNASRNLIGGTAPGTGNYIAGNTSHGVEIIGASAVENRLEGNFIGLDVNLDARANAGYGVTFNVATRNTIGGTAPGAANTIAFNGLDGVFVNTGNRNTILNNSIFLNGGLGIDLGLNGVTANDAGDTDSGANNLQNFPLITAATNLEGTVIIIGSLGSQANSNYTVQFFFSDACDPTGNGEGQSFLGSTSVTADGSGNATFNVTIPTATPGRFVTANATDAAGNTSEFGPCFAAVNVLAPGTFIVNNTANSGPGSLRQAILDSNARVTAGDRIEFNIAGVGPHNISVTSLLPLITDTIIIDGWTQPGSSPNTLGPGSLGNNAAPQICINGTGAGALADGLRLAANNSVVQGLIIIGFNGDAIEVTGNNNVIQGNFLGMVPTGSTMPSANAGHGVHINNGSFNLVGGTTPAAMNRIGNNVGDGVFIPSGSNNTVRGNSIINNGGQAIDLGFSGVNPNDPGDADTGANFQQNFPIVTGATLTTTGLVVRGTLNSRPNQSSTIELFYSSACDSFGNGEAQFPIGQVPLVGDFNGDGQFEIIVATQTPRGVITATATDPAGNTSESSACRNIISTVPPLNLAVTSAADSGAGTLREIITIANSTFSALPHNITFNIPGNGVQIIAPSTPLPSIAVPVSLNGYSQPGSSPNTLVHGNDANILIRLDGANCEQTFGGLVLNSSGNIVRGISFTGWRGNGLVITGGSGHQITGCYFGLCPDDTPTGQFRAAAGGQAGECAECGNLANGLLAIDCSDSTFGGDEPAESCLYGCNGQNGLTLGGAGCLRNLVQGCSSGIDRSGTECRGNGGSGFVVNGGASENLFRDCQSGCNHVNGWHHADLNTRANALRNCTVGTDSLKLYDLGNGGCGARWDGGAFQSSAEGCTFGHNGAEGICGVGLVRGGSFCCNAGDPINNALDGPRVISATASNGQTQVTVEITGAAGFPVEVELYSAPACPCSNEAGSRGRFTITPTITGVSRHTLTLDRQLSDGSQIQATATELVFTSRFGTVATVTGPPGAADLALSIAVVGAPGSSCTTQTVTLVVTNHGPDAASGVVVDTGDLHGSAEILSTSASQGSCAVQNTKVLCNLGGMPSGGTATISIQFKVPSSFGSTRIESRVTSGGPPDPVPQNNQAADGIEQTADVGVRFSSESVRVAPGEQVTLTARVSNSGPCAAQDVKAEIPLSPPLRILSMTASQGSCDPSTGKCAVGELAAGAEATVTIVAIADKMVPIRSEGATVGTTTRDPNAVNNFDGVVVSGIQRGGLQARQGGGGEVVLEWEGDGKLQFAPNLNGTVTQWADLPGNPTSPHTNAPSETRRFFRLEWPQLPFLDLPQVAVFQHDEDVDGMTQPNSENGSVDVTFLGATDPTKALYFSFALNGLTQISNAPLFTLTGTNNPQTMTFTIDIGTNGFPRTIVPASWFVSTSAVTPVVYFQTSSLPVFRRPIKGATGFQDEALARPPPTNFIGGTTEPVTLLSTFFPNGEVGLNECVPGAIVNSLEYLDGRFALGMDPADIDMESIKTATGWTTNGAMAATWPDLKAQYMAERGLPVSTVRTNSASAAHAAMRAGCDVEISMVGHVAALVGMGSMAFQPGIYTIVVKHDICQGERGGLVTQTGKLDANTGRITGITWGEQLIEFVIECPVR